MAGQSSAPERESFGQLLAAQRAVRQVKARTIGENLQIDVAAHCVAVAAFELLIADRKIEFKTAVIDGPLQEKT